MKVLHVASFMGNIGDNASHKGLMNLLGGILPDASITRLEIRKFYKNYDRPDKMVFDDDFVRLANQYELLIIGGGGFLDYWVPESESGTTIDMDPRLVSKISVPTWITSVGCVPCRPVPDGNLLKFKRFMDALLSNQKVKVAVRNDGSIENLRNQFGLDFANRIPEIMDHGFFYKTNDRPSLLANGRYVAINLTEDQTGIFLQKSSMDRINSYHHHLARICQYIVHEQKMKIVFIPHIYSDVSAIAKMLAYLPDPILREWVSVAPCVQGDDGADLLLSIYRDSSLVLATRLHANICNLAMGKPVIGLAALDRVRRVHASIGSRSVLAIDENLSSDFESAYIALIDQPSLLIANAIEDRKNSSVDIYNSWIASL